MKRFVIVGLGNFGSAAAEFLCERHHEVIALDVDEAKVNHIAPKVTRAVVGDGRQADMLRVIGAQDAEAAIISTGQDIGASLLAAMALADVGIKEIYVKVISHDHARIARRFQHVEAIFPEFETAHNLARRMIQSQSLLNYFHLAEGLGLQEMAVPTAWEGKTLRELDLRVNFKVSVVAIHDVITDEITAIPHPDRKLQDTDSLTLAGTVENLSRVADLP